MSAFAKTYRAYWKHATSDIAPLVTFRVLFGLVACYGAIRFMAEGWIETLLVSPSFYFDFFGFHWLPRTNLISAYLLYSVITASALGIAVGYRYRWATMIFLVSFTYAELLDATNYLNHYYLVVLLAILLCVVPANTWASLDVKQGRVAAQREVPSWCIHIIMLQLAFVYFFAGLAKVNADWLLRAMPMAIWLPERAGTPVIGPLLEMPFTAYLFSWAGMIYDLSIVFFLLWRRSRPLAYFTVVVFHTLTWSLFNIGLFPLIMMSSTLIFFDAGWHTRLHSKLSHLVTRFFSTLPQNLPVVTPAHSFTISKALPFVLCGFFAIQVLLPLRTLAYPGPVAWGEEGYRFGWRVMLVEKAGTAEFTVVNSANGRTSTVHNLDYLTAYQQKQMAIQPDFILQFGQYLAEVYENEHGFQQPQVFVDSWVSLNGRRSRRLIAANANLAQLQDGLLPKPWILPFE